MIEEVRLLLIERLINEGFTIEQHNIFNTLIHYKENYIARIAISKNIYLIIDNMHMTTPAEVIISLPFDTLNEKSISDFAYIIMYYANKILQVENSIITDIAHDLLNKYVKYEA